MTDKPRRIYNEAVMRFVQNTRPSEETLQQWEQQYPNVRFRDYGHNRTGLLAELNKFLERRIYGRAYDVEELPDAWRRHAWGNLFAGLNSVRPGPRSMPYGYRGTNFGRPLSNKGITDPNGVQEPGVNVYSNNQVIPELNRTVSDFPMVRPDRFGPQSNRNPATGEQEFIRDLGYGAPSPNILRMITRQSTRNEGSRPWQTDPITGNRVPSTPQEPMSAYNLHEYDPTLANMRAIQDQVLGMRAGPGENVLVGANQTPTGMYNAATIERNNPLLYRHLEPLIKALLGK